MSMMLSKHANMGSSFNEFKRQASFFLRDKINTARLKLTDVTPAQLLTEEVTNGNPWSPDPRTMRIISTAAFEVDDFWRIVDILHKRFMRFDKNNWRMSYNSLILLEHLLTHGPKSAADEFQDDKDVIREMKGFQFIEKGFDWGLRVQNLSERVLNLLQDEQLMQEERAKARKVTGQIKGFGSFYQRPCSLDADLDGSSVHKTYGRWNTHCYDYHGRENELLKSELEALREEMISLHSRTGLEENRRDERYTMDHPFSDSSHHGTDELLLKKLV